MKGLLLAILAAVLVLRAWGEDLQSLWSSGQEKYAHLDYRAALTDWELEETSFLGSLQRPPHRRIAGVARRGDDLLE